MLLQPPVNWKLIFWQCWFVRQADTPPPISTTPRHSFSFLSIGSSILNLRYQKVPAYRAGRPGLNHCNNIFRCNRSILWLFFFEIESNYFLNLPEFYTRNLLLSK